MNDLISRQSAIDAVHEEFDDCLVWDESGQRTADEFETIIDRLPSVQPQQTCEYWDSESKFCALYRPSAQPDIIRCKDCKQFRRWIDTDICFCNITESEMSDNDFCSRAERRTDEAD